MKLEIWGNNPPDSQICTGTLVTTGWLLTAAHCITNNTTDIDIYDYDGNWTWGNQWHRHPDAAPDGVDPIATVDVAMVQLGEDAPYSAGLSASPTVAVGTTLACYGYGWWATNGSGLGSLWYADESVARTSGDPVPGGLVFDTRRYTINKNNSGQIFAPGDSGGPCFEKITGKLAGVQSTTKTDWSSSEQVKFNFVRQWVIDTIANN